MAAGRAFDIRPAGMLALDVARVEAGLLLIDVDFNSSKKALIESQKYSPFEMGLGGWCSSTRGRSSAARRSPTSSAADRRVGSSASKSAGRRSSGCTKSSACRRRCRPRRRASPCPSITGRPPGRPRDDDDVVAGVEEADCAGHDRRAARGGRHRGRVRDHGRSRPPQSARHGREDAVLQPRAKNRAAFDACFFICFFIFYLKEPDENRSARREDRGSGRSLSAGRIEAHPALVPSSRRNHGTETIPIPEQRLAGGYVEIRTFSRSRACRRSGS